MVDGLCLSYFFLNYKVIIKVVLAYIFFKTTVIVSQEANSLFLPNHAEKHRLDLLCM